jgi:hypothetical protein
MKIIGWLTIFAAVVLLALNAGWPDAERARWMWEVTLVTAANSVFGNWAFARAYRKLVVDFSWVYIGLAAYGLVALAISALVVFNFAFAWQAPDIDWSLIWTFYKAGATAEALHIAHMWAISVSGILAPAMATLGGMILGANNARTAKS